MKQRITVVVGISVLSLALFVGLVYYGWTHRWGALATIDIKEPLELAMPRLEHALELEPGDFDHNVWQELSPLTIPLLHQISAIPRARNLVPELGVRAFHNGQEAYVLLEWKDEVESRAHDVAEFPDAAAIAFSLAEEPPSASIMMGFEAPVNVWQWKANLDARFWRVKASEETFNPNVFYTYEETAAFPDRTAEVSSACQDLLARGLGTVTLKEKTNVSGRGQWRDGTWRVILKRPLSTADTEQDVQLSPGKMHVVFALWDGNKGDRGSRKSISDWAILDVKSTASSTAAEPEAQLRPLARADPRGGGGFVFSLLPVAHAQGPTPTADVREPRVITIKAKRFEYAPNQITLQKGDLVTIRLESLDVTHGLYLDGYGIKVKANPAEVGQVTFVADKTGRFTWRCSETCGEFHPYMVGYLTVEPNARFYVFTAGTLGACAVMAFVLVFRRKEKTA
jgi:heme/copper-type cytochrome/quinol oxidase subunit 2